MARVNVLIETDGLEIFADPMLNKVFHNLMDNSIKHGQHISTILIGHESSDDGIFDRLPGRRDADRRQDKKKLFIEGSGKHHGLGFFLVKKIHNITYITIQETGEPGKGARFEMKVPTGKYRPGTDWPDQLRVARRTP